jgi:hypothetical protein
MNKLIKMGALLLVLAIAFSGASCKKSNEDEVAAEVATQIASTILTDMLGVGFADAPGNTQASSCKYARHTYTYNFAPTCFVNPSPGHGWYSGSYTVTVQTNCNIDEGIMSTCNCILGATYTSGQTVSGTINIDGDAHLVYSTNALNIHLDVHTGSTGLEIEGRTYTISLYCLMWGNLYGGNISIKGKVGNQEINFTSTY